MKIVGHGLPIAALLFPAAAASAAARQDAAPLIIREETNHSQILEMAYQLADERGPRLTGSPNMLSAAKWALGRMTGWGLKNAHLEPWLFGHPGWANRSASGYALAPARFRLDFRVVAWTPGTHGLLSGSAVRIDPPPEASRTELRSYLESMRKLVKGRIVLVGSGASVGPDLDPSRPRLRSDYVADQLDPNAAWQNPPPLAPSKILDRAELNIELDSFLVRAGALMRVNDARLPNGQIRAFANATYEPARALPTVVLNNDDFGRLSRFMSHGRPVRLAFEIKNESFPGGRTAYNVIADLPGTDRADEIVMIGAHLDSWHSATGATDDAVGCAIVMEAARILERLHLPLRRTVRVALWSGEEQGLLGSQDYVARHFGTVEAPGPEFGKLAAYINIDGGTGRIRSASIFGPPQAGRMIDQALAPYRGFGVAGAVAHHIRRLRSTDGTTFSRAGLPAIGFAQDPINYESGTWHSNLDNVGQILPADAQQAAIVIAGLAYSLASSDELVPRFGRSEMPAAEGPTPKARPILRVRPMIVHHQ